MSFLRAPVSAFRRLRLSGPLSDQVLWAATGFAASVVIGRSLGAEALGAYAFGLAWLNGLLLVIDGLIIDPALVLGPARLDDRLRQYVAVLMASVVIVGAIGVVGAIIAGRMGGGQVAQATAGALIITPAYLLAQMARRAPYLTSQIRHAVIGDLVYLIVTVAGLLGLAAMGSLDVVMAFLVMGGAALAQVVTVSLLWRPALKGIRDKSLWKAVVSEHWGYGKWLMAGSLSSWVGTHGFVVLVGLFGSLGHAGGYRASQALVNPVTLFFSAVTLSALPGLSRGFATHGYDALRRSVPRIGLLLVAASALFFVGALVMGRWVLQAVFGPELAGYGGILLAIAAAWIPLAWVWAISAGLQAARYSRGIFFGQVVAAIVGIVGGYLLGRVFGIAGVLAALVMSYIARLLVVQFGFAQRRAGGERGPRASDTLPGPP